MFLKYIEQMKTIDGIKKEVEINATQTLTNKTLTSPTITSPTINGGITSTDTYTGFPALKIDSSVFVVAQNTYEAYNDHSGAIIALGGIACAKDFYTGGAINNNYICQITKFAVQSITFGIYTKVTSLSSSNTSGFNNLLTNMDNGTSDIKIRRAGKYRLVGRAYFETGTSNGSIVFGKNGTYWDDVFNAVSQGYQCYIETVANLALNDLISLYVAVGVSGNVGGTANYKGIYLRAELIN